MSPAASPTSWEHCQERYLTYKAVRCRISARLQLWDEDFPADKRCGILHPASGVASQTQNKECGRLRNSSPFLLLSAALTQLPSMAHLVYRLILPISWNSSKTSISRFFYSKENPPPKESWTRDNNETWPSGPCQHFFLNLTIRLLPQSWEVQSYLKLAIQIISPSFCSM